MTYRGGGLKVERLQLVSCSIRSAGRELIKVNHGDQPWLLLVTAASMIISLDAGPGLIRGNGGWPWLLVAAASMIFFLDAGLECVPHLSKCLTSVAPSVLCFGKPGCL